MWYNHICRQARKSKEYKNICTERFFGYHWSYNAPGRAGLCVIRSTTFINKLSMPNYNL